MVHSLLNCPMLNLFAILASCHPRLSCDWMCQLKTKVPQHCSSMHSPHLNASIWWLFLKLRFHQKLPNNGLLSNIPVQSWKMLFKTTMLRQQAMISHHENKQSLSGQKSNTFGQWVGWRVSGDEWRSILRHWILNRAELPLLSKIEVSQKIWLNTIFFGQNKNSLLNQRTKKQSV